MNKEVFDIKNIYEELASVQPMDSNLFSDLYKVAKSENELIEEGYEPVSSFGLMWIKR